MADIKALWSKRRRPQYASCDCNCLSSPIRLELDITKYQKPLAASSRRRTLRRRRTVCCRLSESGKVRLYDVPYAERQLTIASSFTRMMLCLRTTENTFLRCFKNLWNLLRFYHSVTSCKRSNVTLARPAKEAHSQTFFKGNMESKKFVSKLFASFKGATIPGCWKWVDEEPHEIHATQEGPKAFAKEIVLWAHLSHENILPFYGIYEGVSGRICIISPWVDPGDLTIYLQSFPHRSRLPLVRI